MRLPRDTSGGTQTGAGMNTSANASEPDFSEFMWMAEEDLEAFDREVLCEVSQVMMECASDLRDDEEEFLQGMLKEEEERDTVYYHQYYQDNVRRKNTANLTQSMAKLEVGKPGEVIAKSNLNPHAKEFVPRQIPSQRPQAPMVMLARGPSNAPHHHHHYHPGP